MTQANVVKYLRKKKGWVSTTEINKALNITTASANLGKMLKHKEVLREERMTSRGGIIHAYWKLVEEKE